MLMEAEFWVTVAFFIFVAVLLYMGAHKMIVSGLDRRRERIKAELDEAHRLREEARALLADYQRKQRDAESEAQAIIANAQAEAERIAAETKAKMAELVSHRTAIAQAKIAQAEVQALAEVRAAAAEAAVAAAARILAQSAKGPIADELIAQGITAVKAKLN
jgi:F-type H+-transporting ATPase subunit b